MKSQAIYVGKNPFSYEERVDKVSGEVLPSRKGFNYCFFCNEWDEETDEMYQSYGKTRKEVRYEDQKYEDTEIEKLRIGDRVIVQVNEISEKERQENKGKEYLCKFIKKEVKK